MALGPDDDGKRAAQVGLPSRHRRVGLGTGDPEPSNAQVGQGAGQIVDRREQEVLGRARRCLDRRRREGCLAARREDDAMGTGCLGAPKERAQVLRVLERIEDQDERRLAALDGPGENLVDVGEAARRNGQGDPLVAVEAGKCGQGATLDLDDRDPEARRVEHEALKRLAPLRDDQEPMGGTASDEGLLDGAAARDELLLIGSEQRRSLGIQAG